MEQLPYLPPELDAHIEKDPELENRLDAVRIARNLSATDPDNIQRQEMLFTMTEIALDYATEKGYLPEKPDQS